MTTAMKAENARATVDREDLLAALAAVVPLLRRVSTLPILKTVRWDGASVTGTDLDQTVIVPLPGEHNEEWPVVCVPGATMLEIVRQLPDMALDLTWTERDLVLSAGGDRFTLQGMAADDFPDVPEVDGPTMTCAADVLRAGLATVQHAIGPEARPVYSGVHFRDRDGLLMLEATDGGRLAQVETALAAPKGLTVILPESATERLLALLAEAGDDEVTLTVEPTRIAAELPGEWRIVTRLIDGPYPNVDQVIPKADSGALRCEIIPAQWLSALARAMVFAPDFHRVEVDLAKGKVTLGARHDERGKGAASATYETPTPSEVRSFAINGLFLRDALRALPSVGGKLTLLLSNRKPVVIEGARARALIMPLVDTRE